MRLPKYLRPRNPGTVKVGEVLYGMDIYGDVLVLEGYECRVCGKKHDRPERGYCELCQEKAQWLLKCLAGCSGDFGLLPDEIREAIRRMEI